MIFDFSEGYVENAPPVKDLSGFVDQMVLWHKAGHTMTPADALNFLIESNYYTVHEIKAKLSFPKKDVAQRTPINALEI